MTVSAWWVLGAFFIGFFVGCGFALAEKYFPTPHSKNDGDPEMP